MTSITKLSLIVGILLIGLGVILYISTGSKSLTAMIPSFFGLPILSKTSTEVIMYRVRFDNLDKNWWPTNNNL